jgi:cysteine-rich repeat protein
MTMVNSMDKMNRNSHWMVWLAGIVVLLTAPAGASAQEVACDNTTSLPCGFQVDALSLDEVPPLFQFQSRVAQAKLPIGDMVFQTVVVKVLRGRDVICMEQMANVNVEDSILNLVIGKNMSCDLARTVAENADLALQICLGGPGNCLKPCSLASTPYAFRATYASLAQRAPRANTAVEAGYAHRASADRDMPLRRKVSMGYFGFRTPGASEIGEIYGQDAFQPYADGGFLQWAPVGNPDSSYLHIVAKDGGTDRLAMLDEVVLASEMTRATGNLVVDPPADGQGLVVTAAGGHFVGDVTFDNALLVTGNTEMTQPLDVTGATEVNGSVVVAGDFTVQGSGMHVTGDSSITGGLLLIGDLEAQAGFQAAVDAVIEGSLTSTGGVVSSALTVGGIASLAELEAGITTVAGPAVGNTVQVSSDATAGGIATIGGKMTVTGTAVFNEHVTFSGGAEDTDVDPDMKYVQYADEIRAIVFDGSLALAGAITAGGDINLTAHQLKNFRFPVAAEPPVACEASTNGFAYLDTIQEALLLCLDGEYITVRGGAECGNSYVQPGEGCDDGNLVSNDGCTFSCTVESGWICTPPENQPTVCETVCSDGLIRGLEECDDGNSSDGDGCDSQCNVVQPWVCLAEPSLCNLCGDGSVDGVETCDDQNLTPGDGCSASCVVEGDWYCSGEPSLCSPDGCGDGLIQAGEDCDDGNVSDGDGCTHLCVVDNGWICDGEPSICTPPCGNGKTDAGEACDDGNESNGDGCSSSCTIESGWTCSGQPSQCELPGECVYVGQKNGNSNWNCPSGYRMPYSWEWSKVYPCVAGKTSNYYHGTAYSVGGCNCKWNGGWCGQKSIETFDQGRLCGDYWAHHVCISTGGGGGNKVHHNGLGKTWYNNVSTGTKDSSQAKLSCEQSFGNGNCSYQTGDCAGHGWCNKSGSPKKCWGWSSGCSGGAGRVWKYGNSYTTYGWWD